MAPLIAVARISDNPWLRIPARVWIELFRGLPVILLMFFAALALDFSIFRAVVFGLVLYNTAVLSEILRAGIASLPDGQREAALAVGLTSGQTLRMVLLPQAARRMLPSLISQLVVLLKDTSLGYIVGYSELLRVNRELRDFFGNKYIFSIFFVTAALYIGVNMTLSQVASYLERRGTTKAAGGPAAQGPGQRVLSWSDLPSGPAVSLPQHRGHDVEADSVQHRAFASYRVVGELQDAVQPDPARPPGRVPRTAPERQPAALTVAVGLAAQHQPEHQGAPAADHEHRPVLPLARVVLVRDPGPDDLTGVGPAVEIRRVLEQPVVARGDRCRLRPPGPTKQAAGNAWSTFAAART